MRRCIVATIAAVACLLVGAQNMALVNIPAACMRAEPRHASELLTQAGLGTPVMLYEYIDGWWYARYPDGYKGYVNESSLTPLSDSKFAQWQNARRLIVTAIEGAKVYTDTLRTDFRAFVGDLYAAAIVEGRQLPGSYYVEVTFPDGRRGWTEGSQLMDINEWIKQEPDYNSLIESAYKLMGAPYLWGGTTTKALDCSGLIQQCYFLQGLLLPRDASQQALVGEVVDHTNHADLRRGDLLFFGENERITHVAIYDVDGRYVHSSGRVFRASLDPDDEEFIGRIPVKAVRISAPYDTFALRYHPWYFTQPE